MSSTTKCPSARLKRRNLLGAGIAAALLAPRNFAAVRGVEYHVDREGNAISVRRDNAEIGRIESHSPVAIAVHPSGRFVYVVNAVGEYEFLPRGTVETFEVVDDGALRLIGTTPLSLSGTFPSDISLSPDGRHAVVAIAGGKAYNVLPVGADGTLEEPSQIVKRYDVEPERVAFDVTGQKLYGGAGETFRFENGRIEV
jgi:6-phosphogluconolactonase